MPILIFVYLAAISNFIFRQFNRGLARNSRGQQLRRYLLASLQAIIPMCLLQPSTATLVAALLTATLWIVTYNVVYHLAHRATSPDYDNHMDIAFGIYLFGWLTAGQAVLSTASPVVAGIVFGVIETLLILLPMAQAIYYAIYRTCVDEAGMQPLLNTYLTEAVEFVRSFAVWKSAAILVAIIATTALCVAANCCSIEYIITDGNTTMQTAIICLTVAIFAYFTIYIWKKRHGLFVRTGIMTLYIDTRNYNREVMLYRSGMKQRLESLTVENNIEGKTDNRQGKTIIMVIGESACRDYMSAFQPEQPWQTTPWETEKKNDNNSGFIFFPNAYSCAMQTVPSLERVLTERNQYNDKPFCDSCSIVDIAHRAGYRVKWYSNQSYIGINDTSVTLVAQTADTAKWVKKEGGVQQFDESLLTFLDEINPEEDNFVVLHLKGSHFNYENRYPASYADKHNLRTDLGDVECYRNSIHYTDTLLHRVFDYADSRLNLQSMVYFSDHGGIPDMRRSPRFLGFKMVRIPMWVYMSDNYRKEHSATAGALVANKDKYFTNDLVYELMCGIFDIRSNHYDPTQSIASPLYKYRREDLMTYDGRIRIEDDDLDQH